MWNSHVNDIPKWNHIVIVFWFIKGCFMENVTKYLF